MATLALLANRQANAAALAPGLQAILDLPVHLLKLVVRPLVLRQSPPHLACPSGKALLV